MKESLTVTFLVPLLLLLSMGQAALSTEADYPFGIGPLTGLAQDMEGQRPLDNDSITKLVQSGLDDETIVNLVNTRPGKYSLRSDDITKLKRSGVSEKIITAMLNKLVDSAAQAGDAENRDQPVGLGSRASPPHPGAPDLRVPTDPGLYAVMSSGGLRHITGRPTSFTKTGSLLASGLTAGIHARRMNTQIAGESAYVTVGRTPTFYYRVAQNAPDQVVPGTLSLILTRMTVKAGRRQFELDANGILRHSQGISVRHQHNFDTQEIEPRLFELKPDELNPGQYAFFLYVAGPEGTRSRATTGGGAGGEALRGFLYDFQVE
jgi:hypothetical protein